MKTYKKILFSVIITVLFFGLAELVSRIFVFPGSYDYIERRIIEHNLSQHKKSGEFRIFLYGESTMHGGALYPYSVIRGWLKLYLADLLPADVMRNVTIVNFGRMGADSNFTTNAFLETMAYKPDLAIFYIVHNDFCIPEYRPDLVSKRSLSHKFKDLGACLPKRSSLLNLFNRLVIRMKVRRNMMLDAKLAAEDPWYNESEKPEAFTESANLLAPGSPQHRLIEEKFKKNIEKIIKAGQTHGIPIIFFEGLSRWKDYEPVVSMHNPMLTKDMLAAWERYFSEAEDLFTLGENSRALSLYRKCIDIDPSYALAYYREAECYERMGETGAANKNYAIANDNDHFPIRAPSLVNRFYEGIRTAGLNRVYIIDTQKLIEDNSPGGIVGQSLTMDQIHPSPEGQALMALEIAKIIYKNDLLVPQKEWRWDRMRSIDELKRALNMDSDKIFHVYTATASYLAKHYKESVKFLEKALTIKPRSVFVKSWLAWTYWKLGRSDKALALYQELYKEKPSLASAFFAKHPDIKKAFDNKF